MTPGGTSINRVSDENFADVVEKLKTGPGLPPPHHWSEGDLDKLLSEGPGLKVYRYRTLWCQCGACNQNLKVQRISVD